MTQFMQVFAIRPNSARQAELLEGYLAAETARMAAKEAGRHAHASHRVSGGGKSNAQRQRFNERLSQAATYIRQRGTVAGTDDLSKALGCTPSTAREHVHRLKEMGLVTTQIVRDGRRHLLYATWLGATA